MRPLFWLFVAAFNVVGFADLVGDYAHAVQLDLPAMAGQLGAMYWVPVIYVPLLMITHVAAPAFGAAARRSSSVAPWRSRQGIGGRRGRALGTP